MINCEPPSTNSGRADVETYIHRSGRTGRAGRKGVCITLTTGLQQEAVMKIIEKAAADLLRSMGASRWQIFRHLEFPAALGYFFSGLRVSVSYAVVGAVISEWLGGFEGLGVYMTRVRKAYAFDKMFAVIIFIVVVSLLLMALVTALRRLTMPWEAYEKIERND